MKKPKRWTAVITYITGRQARIVQFEEYNELGKIIERGPNWNELGPMTITLNRQDLDSIDVAMN